MWLAEVLSGGFYFLLSIIIAMIGVKHNIKEPERKSFAMFLSYASASLWNWFLSKLEKLFNVDFDNNGVIGTTGKPKESTPPKPNQETTILAPVSHASPLDGLARQRHLESEAANTRYRLEKDLKLLRRENLELKQAKKSNPKNSKSTPEASSLKGKPLDKSKLPPIDKTEGWNDLEPQSQNELKRFRTSIIEKKKSLENVSKAGRNAFDQVVKKEGETKKRNQVKLNWVSIVLANHNQKVLIKNGSFSIESM
jgi:hypothetical protein